MRGVGTRFRSCSCYHLAIIGRTRTEKWLNIPLALPVPHTDRWCQTQKDGAKKTPIQNSVKSSFIGFRLNVSYAVADG